MRELENTVERAVVLATTSVIESKDLVDFEKGSSLDEAVEASAPVVSVPPKLTTEMTLEKIVMNERTLKLEELCQIYILKVLRKNNESKDYKYKIQLLGEISGTTFPEDSLPVFVKYRLSDGLREGHVPIKICNGYLVEQYQFVSSIVGEWIWRKL